MDISTKIPGMSGDSDFNNLYSRGQANSGQGQRKGTVVPGMNQVAPEVEKNSKNKMHKHSEPVVGFLYSISRQGFGEFWPLHIGANSIGRSPEKDIYLPELTVSENHASLNIKQLKSTNKIIASIRDEGSKNGIYVNDEELGYDSHEVKNHDILTIGDNYKILVILIDAQGMGLTIAENFQPADEPVEEVRGQKIDFPDDTSNLYNSENRNVGGTVAMDGSAPLSSGKTKFL